MPMRRVTKSVSIWQVNVLPARQSTSDNCGLNVAYMATDRPGHLFIEEWLRAKGFSDEEAGEKIGVSRETVYRWRTEQHRLNPQKILQLADLCGIRPADLWRMPTGRDSLDLLLDDLPENVRDIAVEMATDIMRRLAKRLPH